MTPEQQLAAARRRTARSSAHPAGRAVWLPPPRNIVEFVTGADYLGERLYPRQLLLLKIIADASDLLTSYDYRVLGRWGMARSLQLDEGVARWQGTMGIGQDIYERLEDGRDRGRAGFTEVVLALGRRSGKSYMGALMAAWSIVRFLTHDDPHRHYGIQADKLVSVLVFSGSLDRAKRDQFGDLHRVLTRSPWFKPYILSATATRIDFATRRSILNSGSSAPPVALRAEAVQTTELSARGPATYVAILDEAAWLRGDGSTSSIDEIYDAVRPSIAQFGGDGLLWMASSPTSMLGTIYDRFQAGMAHDPTTGLPLNSHVFAAQLESFELYLDWQNAHELEMWKGGPKFPRFDRAILEYNDEARALEAQDPYGFAIEYRAQWATSADAYLRPDVVHAMFQPTAVSAGVNRALYDPAFEYFAHGDPSNSNCNFGFAIGHIVKVDGVEHAVIDYLHAWRPAEFPDGLIDYQKVLADIVDLADRYRLKSISFDPFNTVAFKGDLESKLRAKGCKTRVEVVKATATRNEAMYDNLKSLAGEHRIHLPVFRLALDELMFLRWTGTRVDAPKAGPVTTRDVADSIANLLYKLFEDKNEHIFDALRGRRNQDW